MDTRTRVMACCGVKEIVNIKHRKPKQVVLEVAEDYHTFGRAAMYVFTAAQVDCEGVTYGDDLKRYIEDNGLGKVTTSGDRKNPNSGNIIRIYIWHVDTDALLKFYEEHSAPILDAVVEELGTYGVGIGCPFDTTAGRRYHVVDTSVYSGGSVKLVTNNFPGPVRWGMDQVRAMLPPKQPTGRGESIKKMVTAPFPRVR